MFVFLCDSIFLPPFVIQDIAFKHWIRGFLSYIIQHNKLATERWINGSNSAKCRFGNKVGCQRSPRCQNIMNVYVKYLSHSCCKAMQCASQKIKKNQMSQMHWRVCLENNQADGKHRRNAKYLNVCRANCLCLLYSIAVCVYNLNLYRSTNIDNTENVLDTAWTAGIRLVFRRQNR